MIMMRSGLLIHPDELSRTWIDRMADAGITTLGIHPVGGKRAPRTLSELLKRCGEPDFQALLDYAATRGLQIEYEFHAAGYLMPRTLFAEHPEYFRMNAEGVRVPDHNFCVSNEEGMKLVAMRAVDAAKRLYGSRPVFYFWMDDQKDSHCMCPKCRHLSGSDQALLVINRILAEIRQIIPEAKAAYLAYYDSLNVPSVIKPADGVFLEYAPLEKYNAKGEDAAALIAHEEAMLEPLLAYFGEKDAKVLEYWFDNSMFSEWKKPPKAFALDEARMNEDIADYRKKGFCNIASFACYLGYDYEDRFAPVDIEPFAKAIHAGCIDKSDDL